MKFKPDCLMICVLCIGGVELMVSVLTLSKQLAAGPILTIVTLM